MAAKPKSKSVKKRATKEHSLKTLVLEVDTAGFEKKLSQLEARVSRLQEVMAKIHMSSQRGLRTASVRGNRFLENI